MQVAGDEDAGLSWVKPRAATRADGQELSQHPGTDVGGAQDCQRHLYDSVWHVWTDEDQIKWVETVRPQIQGAWGWDGEADIATYIFAMYFKTPRTAANRRQDWSAERAARRSAPPDSVSEVAATVAMRYATEIETDAAWRARQAPVASYKLFELGSADVEQRDAAALLVDTFATMRAADFRYECSELVERATLSSRADALTAPAA